MPADSVVLPYPHSPDSEILPKALLSSTAMPENLLPHQIAVATEPLTTINHNTKAALSSSIGVVTAHPLNRHPGIIAEDEEGKLQIESAPVSTPSSGLISGEIGARMTSYSEASANKDVVRIVCSKNEDLKNDDTRQVVALKETYEKKVHDLTTANEMLRRHVDSLVTEVDGYKSRLEVASDQLRTSKVVQITSSSSSLPSPVESAKFSEEYISKSKANKDVERLQMKLEEVEKERDDLRRQIESSQVSFTPSPVRAHNL